MIGKGVKIQWDHSDEYIEIEAAVFSENKSITSTLEWWKSDKEWVKWNTHSHTVANDDGSFEIDIFYESDKNKHLAVDDVCFGKAKIWIAPNQKKGRAYWDDNSNVIHSGETQWKRLDNPLIGKKRREITSRIFREQMKFRYALFFLDKRCVISGERTSDVLEAAHLIPASSGGAETIGNGILLRADLHRLLDAGKFSFNVNGDVVLKKGRLSKTYQELLREKSLPTSTRERVRDALTWLADRASES